MHIKNFYLSFFSHIRFSSTNPGNTRRDGRWKMHWIIPCSDGAPKKNPTIYAVHSRRGDVSQPSCKTQIMIICRLLFFPLGFQSLFSKSIRSPLNYQIYRSFAIDFFFLQYLPHPCLINPGCYSKPINKLILSYKLKFAQTDGQNARLWDHLADFFTSQKPFI